jgi:hypothetical protein
MLHLILGGAALQRCDKHIARNKALAAEGLRTTVWEPRHAAAPSMPPR